MPKKKRGKKGKGDDDDYDALFDDQVRAPPQTTAAISVCCAMALNAARARVPWWSHLQVEASGPGNAAGVQQRLAGQFRGGEIAQGRACAVWLKVDAPELSSGPGWEIQEVSRVGAQGVTSKSKLLAREMPRVCSRGLRVDSGAAKLLQVAPAQPGPKSVRRSSPRDL